jgi:hypothetical protein
MGRERVLAATPIFGATVASRSSRRNTTIGPSGWATARKYLRFDVLATKPRLSATVSRIDPNASCSFA